MKKILLLTGISTVATGLSLFREQYISNNQRLSNSLISTSFILLGSSIVALAINQKF